jgi:hypothetical protein
MDKLQAGNTIKVNPIQCFTSNRIDLIFKLIYGESIKRNSKARYPRKLYKRHLFSITGGNGKFVEHGNIPPKAGFDQFDEIFRSLINGNVEDFSPVQIDVDHRLNNGAHRTVAAFLKNELIFAQVDEKPRGIIADYNFFKTANRWRYRLNQENLDYALLRLTSLNPRIQVFVVFPSMRNKSLLNELRSQESFFLEREFRLNPIAKWKLLDFLYPKAENFVNLNSENNHNAFRDRFNAPGKLRIFFFENNEGDFLARLKVTLRNKYRLDNGSIHTPDNNIETNHLLEVLLVKNSRRNLHNLDLEYARSFSQRWETSKPKLSEAAIVGSTPLALLGIRPSRDLDLIFHSGGPFESSESFDLHNIYWESKGFNIDELIVNPRNFMSVYGVKYVSIRNVLRFKFLRHERKDLKDLLLILRLEFGIAPMLFLSIKHTTKGYLRIFKTLSRNLAR